MAPHSFAKFDIGRVEELVRDLTGEPGTPNDLMREHLEALRFYRLGSMPREYGQTLDLANALLPQIEDRQLRERVEEFLRGQER